MEFTSYVGGAFQVYCNSLNARFLDVEWTLFAENGMPIQISNFWNVTQHLTANNRVGVLVLNYLLPQYNLITFRCSANTSDSGVQPKHSNDATLRIQGIAT